MNLEDLDPKIYSDLYLWAASHYLSSWPQEWCGEKLANVMLSEEGDDDFAEKDSIELWDAMKHIDSDDVYLETDAYITCLMRSLEDVPKEVLDSLIKKD
ncbi:MAG: hypothetical protein ACO21T_11555 [Alphaproteobacteria bacterium]